MMTYDCDGESSPALIGSTVRYAKDEAAARAACALLNQGREDGFYTYWKTECESCGKNEQHFIASGMEFNTSCLSEYNGQTLCPDCIPAN